MTSSNNHYKYESNKVGRIKVIQGTLIGIIFTSNKQTPGSIKQIRVHSMACLLLSSLTHPLAIKFPLHEYNHYNYVTQNSTNIRTSYETFVSINII